LRGADAHDTHGQVQECVSNELRHKQLQRQAAKAGCIIECGAMAEKYEANEQKEAVLAREMELTLEMCCASKGNQSWSRNGDGAATRHRLRTCWRH
jgi:hypothetical protein